VQNVCSVVVAGDHADVVAVVLPDDSEAPPLAAGRVVPHAAWLHYPVERTQADRGTVGSVFDVLRLPAAAGSSSSGSTLLASPSRHWHIRQQQLNGDILVLKIIIYL